MTTYYLDASAIVKKHVTEEGSSWVRSLVLAESGNFLMTSRLSMAEVYSALNRRRREGSLTDENFQIIEVDFRWDCQTRYEFIEIVEDLVELTILILGRHPLRAIDAIHLASAIVTEKTLVEKGIPSLIFVSADDRLNSAAQTEGLTVENPNHY